MSKVARCIRAISTVLTYSTRCPSAAQCHQSTHHAYRVPHCWRRSFFQTPWVSFRGSKFRVYNEDQDLPLASSDDEDRQPRKYVFLSDDDERLHEAPQGEELDDDSFYPTPESDPIKDALWTRIDVSSFAPSVDPDQHFAEWKAMAVQRESVETQGLTWADTALDITRSVLSVPPLDALTLHSFRVNASRRQIFITLDKFVDPYGSPSLEEISSFSEMLTERLREELGDAVVESLRFEVSSPGAERDVRLPFELERFHHLPMRVLHRTHDDKTSTSVLEFLSLESEISRWRYWNGKFNRKTVKLRRTDFVKELQIPLRDLLAVHLFLDI